MKWLLLFILLLGCQQDEIIFRVVKKAHKEEQQTETQYAESRGPASPCGSCPPKTVCNTKTSRCEGLANTKQSITPSSSPSVLSQKPETTLVYDNHNERTY